MNVKGYLLSVTALIILSEISRMLLPKGKTRRVVEVAYSLVVIITLISPVIKLGELYVGGGDAPAFQADENYFYYADSIYAGTMEKQVKKFLDEKGFPYSSVKVDCERFSIKKLTIYCDEKVIKENFSHIDSSEVTIELSSLLNIDAEAVRIVEAKTD